MEERSDMAQLSTRLAVARLRHQVGQLQSQVEEDRKLSPPTRKVYHCVVDDTALTEAIGDFKKWIGEGGIAMTVPLCTLDGLDAVKKGTEPVNVNARESIRYFDRIQNGSLTVRGVVFQDPSEAFETWEECGKYMIKDAVLPRSETSLTPAAGGCADQITPPSSPGRRSHHSPKSPKSPKFSPNGNVKNGVTMNGMGGRKAMERANTFPRQHQQQHQQRQPARANTLINENGETAARLVPPRRIQQLINCVLYRKHRLGQKRGAPTHLQMARRPDIHLITNNPEVAEWARLFDINVMGSNALEDLIEREDFIFAEKQREYEDYVAAKQAASNGTGRGGRGGRRGGGRGDFDRRGGFHHAGGRGTRGGGNGEPEFVFVREAPRGVARGKGKLWEP